MRSSNEIQKQLTVYSALLDLTVVTATIPFQTPAASGVPWVGRNLAHRLGSSTFKPLNALGKMKGPVVVNYPPGASPAQMAEVHAYVQAANYAVRTGELSATGRVSTTGALRAASNQAAAAERQAAGAAGQPYYGVVGHVPDTTWIGKPVPPIWLDQTGSVNSSVGAQALRYPLGFKPTGFTVGK